MTSRSRQISSWVLGAAVALVLIAFAARLWRLQFQSMWWDEGVSVYLTTVGLNSLTLSKDFSVDLHPPGYYLLLSVWRLAFGPSVFSMRLFSVFGGVITVPITFALARRVARQGEADGPNPRPLPLEGSGVTSPFPWREGGEGVRSGWSSPKAPDTALWRSSRRRIARSRNSCRSLRSRDRPRT